MKPTALPLLRHALQLIAGALIGLGWLAPEDADKAQNLILEASGPVLALVSMVWMLWSKRKNAPAEADKPAAALLAAGLLAIAAAPGCAKVQPGNDPVLVNAERTTVLAVDVFDTFTLWEFNNRLALAIAPDIRKTADLVRLKAPSWLRTARSMTEAYRTNRTPENKANLETAIELLRTGIREAQRYLAAGVPPQLPE